MVNDARNADTLWHGIYQMVLIMNVLPATSDNKNKQGLLFMQCLLIVFLNDPRNRDI